MKRYSDLYRQTRHNSILVQFRVLTRSKIAGADVESVHAIGQLQFDRMERAIVLDIRRSLNEPVLISHLRFNQFQVIPDRIRRFVGRKHAPSSVSCKIS